jgi:serine/threonine protein kinase
MRSFLSVARSVAVDPVQQVVEAFEAQSDPSIERSWDGLGSSKSPSILAALVKSDLQRRFGQGEQPRVAEYLERFPILAESDDRVVSLVYEEFCLLQEIGESPDSEEFCEAYGPWRDSLLSQLAYHHELSLAVGATSPRVKFPSIGDQFERYKLRSVLGTGGVARVYLATEDDLGGRKLAIKVSASFGQEPSILAKLDHHNIVPILTVAHSESGLRGICMPYRPGVTLEELIVRIGRGTPPRRARDLWKRLEPRDEDSPLPPDDQRSGWVGFPIEGRLPEAVAWIGLALANALSYLHGQGVYHRDIKPANVLLAYREGPQLLDFNLAQDPKAPDQVNAALKGGTLPYMAPEQLKAFIDPMAWDVVGPAADLYSLGLVLREILTGQPPDVPASKTSLPRGIQGLLDRRAEPMIPTREINPSVPPALDSIIAKCLAFDPSVRYETAADLAEDLQQYLDRKPLVHAPNSSRIERGANWISRNRLLSAALPVLMGISLLISATRSPAHIPDKPEFREAVRNLDSDLPDDWKRAKVALENLHGEFPRSAWPSLYLGLTLEKLGRQNIRRSTDLFKEACEQVDAEEAINERLRKEPRSASLRTLQGHLFAKAKNYGEARKSLTIALESDRDRPMTFLALADVERNLGHFEEAIDFLSRAIQLEIKMNFGWETIYNHRNALLPIYAKLADQVIDRSTSPAERKTAARHLDGLEKSLASQEETWGKLPQDGLRGLVHRYNDQLYAGCIASCRAVLSADLPDPTKARRLFGVARQRFDGAANTVATGLADRVVYRMEIDNQELKLRSRAAKFLSSPDGDPHPHVGGE